MSESMNIKVHFATPKSVLYYIQIEDLQSNMLRSEQQQARREDQLRQEISDLQQRLQEAEERNQELTHNISAGEAFVVSV